MTVPDFGALFEGFQRSAFRLEVLDRYTVPDEERDLAAFLAGEELPGPTPATVEWLGLVAAARRGGRRMERVRLVGWPLTDYTRFEFAVYPENIAAGEEIRVVERQSLSEGDAWWSSEDFWLFDDETPVVLRYDDEGRFLGIEARDNVETYVDAKREALRRSMDFANFCSQITPVER